MTFGGRTSKSLIDGLIRAALAPDVSGIAQVDVLSFVRYSLVGSLATLVHYLVLVALIERAGTNAGLSAAVGATCGALAGYAGNRRFTFFSRAPHRQALPRFVLVAAGGAIVNGTIVWTGTELLRLHYLVPQVVATVLILVAGFALNRSWTFV